MSSGPVSGPPAPGETAPGPFPEARISQPVVAGTHFPGAWQRLTHALGHNLQHGMWRAEQARRRLERLR